MGRRKCFLSLGFPLAWVLVWALLSVAGAQDAAPDCAALAKRAADEYAARWERRDRAVELIRNGDSGEIRQLLEIDIHGDDFSFTLGRNGELAQLAFPDDNWMSGLHGTLTKSGETVYYVEGNGNRLPTNPTLINNIPVGRSRVELFSGGFLLVGSTVFQIKKYFGKMKSGSP